MYLREFKEFKKRFPNNLQSDAVIACLGDIIRIKFIYQLKNMSNNIGYGTEGYGFCFPNIFEPHEKDEEGYFEEGVMFYNGELEEIISNQEYHEYLKIACKIYLENKPEDKEIVNFYLDKIISNK